MISFELFAERAEAFYGRVSERLRHKQRALTQWDYERIVLERFPEVYKAKCIPAGLSGNGGQPGRVGLVVIPDIRNRFPFDPFEPKAPSDLLADIEAQSLRNLTRRRGEDRMPCLSGDGRHAVYRNSDGYYVDNLDGTPVRPIARTKNVWILRIAAGGKWAVFLQSRKDAEDRRTFHLYVVGLE